MVRAARAGSSAHTSVALRIARTARFVAAGLRCTNSFLAATVQQKYCDHDDQPSC